MSKLEQKITSLVDEGQFLWDHIKFGDLAFEEKEVAAQLISQITKDDILEFYQRVFKQEDSGKLSLQVYG